LAADHPAPDQKPATYKKLAAKSRAKTLARLLDSGFLNTIATG
jgi:hypothetical protein